MTEIKVLLVGDLDRAEFREARQELARRATVFRAADAAAAIAQLADGERAVDLIVAAQAYPGQISAEAIDRLRALAPLARVIGLLGSWCEGEARTGRPWPASIRVYWHQWSAQCNQELDRFEANQPSAWSLPVTAGDEERALAIAEHPLAQGSGRVVVCSQEFEMQNWLCAACRRAGFSPVRMRRGQSIRFPGARAAFFDSTECRIEELDQLTAVVAAVAPAPVVAMLNFPRPEDRARARAAGAAEVVSKPVMPEELVWHLHGVIARNGSSGALVKV